MPPTMVTHQANNSQPYRVVTQAEAPVFQMDKILIVEDDPLVSKDLRERLEALGYRVSGQTQRGDDLVSLAEALRPDLVLIDIGLPGEVDGIQAAQRLRLLPIPFVFVTGHFTENLLRRAKVTEPYGYVLKPYETRELRASIEVALHRFRAEQERQRLRGQFKPKSAPDKGLSGVLSICSYCKKIKETADTWTQIETFIMQRSPTSFSHGLCPECFQRVKKQLDLVEANGLDPGSVVLG